MNKLKGTLCESPEPGRHGHIPQIEWMCPPKLTLDINWGVAAGQESIEATRRRVPTDPRLHREPTDLVDSTIPIIPIMPMEEEGNLLSNSSPFLTSSSMNGETMALAIDAVNALNGVALGQGEPAVGLGMFMQWLNTDTVRKFFSGQSFTGIEATKSVPSETPDQFYRVRENTGVVIPKPIAWTSSVPAQDVLDLDLLAHLLQNPGDVDKLIKICDSTAKGRSCASAIATIPESLLTFPRENTTPGHNSHCITGESSAPPITVSSMVTSSSNKSLINNDIPSLEATMAPMSPLYSSPSTNWESDMEIESPISENGTVAGMRMEPPISPVATFSLPQTASLQPPLNGLPSLLHRNSPLLQMHPYPVSGQTALTAMGLNPLVNDLVTLLMVNQWAAANMIAAFSHSTPPMNCSSLGANTQIVGQRPSTVNRHQKPCTYFNTPRGCRNGANCLYLHR
ncbi:zinc finger CCCH domain-containing protein 30-like [Apium graveolens]|uniref:zinc finger CCCH domain-containing protein 30-like n=1 Tax=Apium graveolens TaxID=4045 RepID=UPI003D78C135